MNGLLDQPATLGHYLSNLYKSWLITMPSPHMWQANPSTSSTLVPVSSKATGDYINDTGSETGAIARAAVGDVPQLLVAIVLVVLFIRCRRKREHVPATATTAPSVYKVEFFGSPQAVHGSEVYHNQRNPTELSAD